MELVFEKTCKVGQFPSISKTLIGGPLLVKFEMIQKDAYNKTSPMGENDFDLEYLN